MNAGANGAETRERLVEAHAVDRQGRRHVLSLADMGFTYRHSAAPEDLIFTEAVFTGPPAEREAIQAEMDAVEHHRETAQPIREKTGGSTFTNPPGKKAWQLIDAAGCRGLRIGGAMVSEMHCNFLINVDTATGYDLELLGETVRARVLETSGVRLEWEIRRIGRFATGRRWSRFSAEVEVPTRRGIFLPSLGRKEPAMGINIKNPRVEGLIRELAAVTGKGQTEAVGEAVERMLARRSGRAWRSG